MAQDGEAPGTGGANIQALSARLPCLGWGADWTHFEYDPAGRTRFGRSVFFVPFEVSPSPKRPVLTVHLEGDELVLPYCRQCKNAERVAVASLVGALEDGKKTLYVREGGEIVGV